MFMKNKSLNKNPPYNIQIRKLRESMGVTQAQLAESIGLTWRSIPNIESGRVSPKLSTLGKIAKSLNSELLILLVPKKELQENKFLKTSSQGHHTFHENISTKREKINSDDTIKQDTGKSGGLVLNKKGIFFFD